MTASDLKKSLKEKEPILGLERTLKAIKDESAKEVYMSSNCKASEDIKRYANMYGVKLIELKEDNTELGVICKKPYSVSVLCFKK